MHAGMHFVCLFNCMQEVYGSIMWQMVSERFLEGYQKSRVILHCKVVLKAIRGYIRPCLKKKKKILVPLLVISLCKTTEMQGHEGEHYLPYCKFRI